MNILWLGAWLSTTYAALILTITVWSNKLGGVDGPDYQYKMTMVGGVI